MPRGDGTGPRGQGPRTGRGLGGRGYGRGMGRGGGKGRMEGCGLGPGGYCVCPFCGAPHQAGTPMRGEDDQRVRGTSGAKDLLPLSTDKGG